MRPALPATGFAHWAWAWALRIGGALGSLYGAAFAVADPFYYRYDANVFPEQAGWSRQFADPSGNLLREIDGGVLRLDTRGSISIFDIYRQSVPALDLQAGEELRLTWRMQTLETDVSLGIGDVFLAVTNAAGRYVYLSLGPDWVRDDSVAGGGAEHSFDVTPGVPHTYELRSADMQTYALRVDGATAFAGSFGPSAIEPTTVAFGDAVQGLTSLSEWDFVEIAVTPEPSSALGLLAAVVMTRLLRRAERCADSIGPRSRLCCCRAPPCWPRRNRSAVAGAP